MSQPAEQLSPLPDVAEEVRGFYDRYPYPPPINNLEKYQWLWQDPQKRRRGLLGVVFHDFLKTAGRLIGTIDNNQGRRLFKSELSQS
jgi:hypothetical protein